MENTYVISDDKKNAIIIDPGCYEDFEKKELLNYVHERELKILAILNTHCHIDHVLGNDVLKKHYKTELWIPKNEEPVLRSIPSYSSNYGFAEYKEAEVDHWYGETNLKFGHLYFQSIEVPGHSPGHMVFYFKAEKNIIGGDVLFQNSIGRTDLPGGNHSELLKNIKEKIYTLPDDVTVYPGHGQQTTIGKEKESNPFVRG